MGSRAALHVAAAVASSTWFARSCSRQNSFRRMTTSDPPFWKATAFVHRHEFCTLSFRLTGSQSKGYLSPCQAPECIELRTNSQNPEPKPPFNGGKGGGQQEWETASSTSPRGPYRNFTTTFRRGLQGHEANKKSQSRVLSVQCSCAGAGKTPYFK